MTHAFVPYAANPGICSVCGAVRPYPCFDIQPVAEPTTPDTPDFQELASSTLWSSQMWADAWTTLCRDVRARDHIAPIWQATIDLCVYSSPVASVQGILQVLASS